MSAICSQYPDYAVVLISAAEGITETTRQHFHLAFTLKVPVIVLVTKTDLIGEEKLLQVRDEVKTLLKSRINIVIKSGEDITIATKGFEDHLIPILFISNTTGQGIDLFKQLLHSLPPHRDWQAMVKDKAEFHITDTDITKDEPPVLWGVVYRGTIKLKQRMQLGPDKNGKFMQVEIQSIRCLKELVQSVQAGQICSFAIKLGASADTWLKSGGQIRRGMVLIDGYKPYKATRSFMGEIWTIDGAVKQMSATYQPLINCHHIRQAASIKIMKESPSVGSSPHRQIEFSPAKSPSTSSKKAEPAVQKEKVESKIVSTSGTKKHVRSRSYPKHPRRAKEGGVEKFEVGGKRIKVLFRFLYHPEYLEVGNIFVIPDPACHVFGEITKVFYDV